MHSYRPHGLAYEVGREAVNGWLSIKTFDDEAAAIAFTNYLNGGDGDINDAKRFLRLASAPS
jgi:hypothetical protein